MPKGQRPGAGALSPGVQLGDGFILERMLCRWDARKSCSPFLTALARTINNFTWSGSAHVQLHQRHLTHALTEFTRLLDGITFGIFLCRPI